MGRRARSINDYAGLLAQVSRAQPADKLNLIVSHLEKITNFDQIVRLLQTLSGDQAGELMLSNKLSKEITTVKQLGRILDLLHEKKSDPHFIAAIIQNNKDKIKHEYPEGLALYPIIDSPPSPSTELTIGDLHGNAMKLIYFLIREGAISDITPSHYAELMTIYETPVADLTRAHITRFNEIVNQIVLNPVGKIRLIGDTLADRGSNDYYTLMILARLHALHAPLEIEISNHDVDFLQASRIFRGEIQFCLITPMYDGKDSNSQIQSRLNLIKLIKKFPELKSQVKTAVEDTYTPSLKLISYALSPDGKSITLYTHAPVGLETIKALADKFSVLYKDNSAQELAETIDAINQKVENLGGIRKVYQDIGSDPEAPLRLITWNRYKEKRTLDRPEYKGDGETGYSLHFVHGHDTSAKQPLPKNVSNLDSEFGKYSREAEAFFQSRGDKLSLSYLCHHTEAAPPKATARLDARSPSDFSYGGFSASTPTHSDPGSPETLSSDSPTRIPGSPSEEEDDDDPISPQA